MHVRNYKESDFPMVKAWWDEVGEIGPLPSMLPEESTFILEIGNKPALCVSLYLTNISECCYVENFIGNPALKGPERRKASKVLSSYIEGFARKLGYRHLLCMAHKDKLKERYKELGYVETLSNVSTFLKGI